MSKRVRIKLNGKVVYYGPIDGIYTDDKGTETKVSDLLRRFEEFMGEADKHVDQILKDVDEIVVIADGHVKTCAAKAKPLLDRAKDAWEVLCGRKKA